MNQAEHNNPLASLYVDNLSPDCTEAILFQKFSSVGKVLSIHLCRDTETKRPLGYAFVNFEHLSAAEKAIEQLNCYVIQGRPMRIVLSKKNPSLQKSGIVNLYITDPDKTIDVNTLRIIFSQFGNILGCKISNSEREDSSCCIRFETEEAVNNAITIINGNFIWPNGKKVFVSRFLPHTNVFIKNFGEEVDDRTLYELFSHYGKITSHRVMYNEKGISKGFGFIAYDNPESAKKAIEALNKKGIGGKTIYVGLAETKESMDENRLFQSFKLQERIESEKNERYKGLNLYVKNLDNTIDSEQLRREFSSYGTITSARVMTDDNNRSLGYGFVCFSAHEEAIKAIDEMNGRLLSYKPLFVGFAQLKEDRKKQLTSHHAQLALDAERMQCQLASTCGAQSQNYIPQITELNLQHNWATKPFDQFQAVSQANNIYQMQASQFPHSVARFNAPIQTFPPQSMVLPNAQVHLHQTVRPLAQMLSNMSIGNQPPSGSYNFPPYMWNPPTSAANLFGSAGNPVQQETFQPTAKLHEKEPLTYSLLAKSGPKERKRLLGDLLFPLIHNIEPNIAGKITGMLLELDNSEILNMIKSQTYLMTQIDRAVSTLRIYEAKRANFQ